MPPFKDKIDTAEESYENKDIENIFGNEKKSFRIYLYKLFTELRNEFKNSDKNLIFDKSFIKFLSKNASLKSLIKNSKDDRCFVGEFITESKKIIKNILKKYKEQVEKDKEKTIRIEEIFGDIIKNNSGFGIELYLLLDNVRILSRGKINENVVFSKDFLKYIHNIHGRFFEERYSQNKNKFSKDEKLRETVGMAYKNYLNTSQTISEQNIREQIHKIDANKEKAKNDKQRFLNNNIIQSGGRKLTNTAIAVLFGACMGNPGTAPTTIIYGATGVAADIVTSDNTTKKTVVSSDGNTAVSNVKSTSAENTSTKVQDKAAIEMIMKEVVSKVEGTEAYKNIKNLLEGNGAIEVNEQNIISYCISLNSEELEKTEGIPEEIKNEIFKRAGEVKKYLSENFGYDFEFAEREKENISPEKINKIVIGVNQTIKQAWTIGSSDSSFHDIKNKISKLVEDKRSIREELTNNNSGIDYITHKMESYLNSNAVNLDDGGRRGITMLYASIIPSSIDIDNEDDLKSLLKTICGENTKFTRVFNEFTNERSDREYERKYNYAVNSLIERYERGKAGAENRKTYSDTPITFVKSGDNPQDQSGLEIANSIDGVHDKLKHYKFKKSESDINKHEESALRYTAFTTTFDNLFNLNDVTIQKLSDLKIDLRSELTNYGIYNQDNNSFNRKSRDKFVSDKLSNTILTSEEIESLGKAMEGLPSEVEKNYEILCGDFYSDQDSIEKITKIYALGEIIDKIRFLFSNIDNQKLGNFMDIQLDENKPANVIGDCLFIKGKINGTETNIKYNLRTGKLYMNSFTKQSLNPPMIIVGNTNPDKEIGDLGSFEETISSMDSIFQIQDNEENGERPGNPGENNLGDSTTNDKDSKQYNRQDSEKLMKKKLGDDLKNIGKIVKEKVGEQGKENNIVDDLLRTFNILPDYGEPKDIEFMGGSALFNLLESIINTNNENDLLEFSNQMKRLMSLCELSRGKNNKNPEKSEFNSVTIFDFNEDNATTDIISLQRAQKKFFSKESGEKDKIKGSKSHFDSSIQLSFADIIVQRCCKNMGNGMEISIIDLERYVDSIEDGLDISNCETKMEEAYN